MTETLFLTDCFQISPSYLFRMLRIRVLDKNLKYQYTDSKIDEILEIDHQERFFVFKLIVN